MNESDSRLLRTTMVQAFAQTVVDESRRSFVTAVGGKGPALREGTPLPVSAAGLPEIGDVVGGHYKLIKLLGQGMFGKVYVAQRLDVPEHQVALKLLPRSLYAGRNVERELVMLATVGHPHVVQLKDHGTTPDYVWLTMPVYQGETLAERLETKRTLTLKQAYDIFLPVARGLEALHAAGLRHQDVKPENIYLAVFGGRVHPILLDLGVAAEVNADFVAGTALYAAPEQVVALHGLPPPSPLSEKMDTYGLAATLLMALVGPKHFPGENATDRAELAAAQKERTEEPIGPGALPEATGSPRDELQAAFRSWLAARPENRPTMKELCEQLEVLLEPDAEEVRQEERRRERQRATIQRLKVAFAAMLVIGAAGAAVAFSQRETLRIAADLDKAKSEGRKSFSELGTCNAAHEHDQRDLAECTTLRTRSREEHERQLEEVMRSGSSSQAEHAREVQGFNKRLKSCEDNAAAQKRTCDDETAHILLDTARDRTALASERDAAKKLADEEKAQLASLSAERDQCRADRNQCVEEREACKAAAATVVRPAPAPRPVSSGAPFAPPSAEPLAPAPVTPAATLDPKAPPPPPLPPPPPPPQQPAQAPLPEPKAMPQPPEPKTI